MDLNQLKEILKVVADSDVAEVEIEEGDLKVVVRKQASVVTMQTAPSAFVPSYMMPPFVPPPYAGPSAAPVQPPPPVLPAAAGAGSGAAPPAGPAAATTNAAPAETPQQEAEAAAPEAAGEPVKAPIVGTFYRSPSPEADPFVQVGDQVKPGDVLCIIEAMKLMNEIECEMTGTVRQVLVENAEAVEYDQTLFIIEPS